MNVVVIGCGYWGKNHVRVFNQTGRLTGVCDINLPKLGLGVKEYSDYNDVIMDAVVDAVVVATPPLTHYQIVMDALQAGKHVLVEKPLTTSSLKAAEMIEQARKQKRVLMVGHVLHYHPAIVELKRWVAAGNLGRMQYAYSQRLNFGRIRQEEDVFWSFAPHDIYLLLSLIGESPLLVEGGGYSYINQSINDVAMLRMGFSSGISAHIFVSWLHPFKEQRTVLVGSDGMAVFDDSREADDKVRVYHHKLWRESGLVNTEKAPYSTLRYVDIEPLRAQADHFIHCVEDGIECQTPGEEGYKILRILERANG